MLREELDKIKEYKYLLTFYCESDGYWQGGYCGNFKESFYYEQTYDIDDEDRLCKSLARLLYDHEGGDYQIYVIKNINYYENEKVSDRIAHIKENANDIANLISVEEKIKEEHEKIAKIKAAEESKREYELQILKELKEKYEEK